MSAPYYKGYWMVTNRCNLRCTYCVLENAPYQLKAELDLNAKKELVSHLYHKLNFRRLTLSGGEVVIFGKHPPTEFVELIRYIRQFRSADPSKNLEMEMYTNGTYLTGNVVQEMQGVIDVVAVTIDSADDNVLSELGRNYKGFNKYFEHIIKICSLLTRHGIELKLHSVISQKNHLFLADEVASILSAIKRAGGQVSCWKFYQYMSYDAPEKDTRHTISEDLYQQFTERVKLALKDYEITLHFKDNQEMNSSLFNILSYGNAQYMRNGDTWSTSQRTEDLRSYDSMAHLFAAHDIDEIRFRKFHELSK